MTGAGKAAQGGGKVGRVPSSFADWQHEQSRRMRREDTLRWGVSFAAVLVMTGGMIWWVLRLPSPPLSVPEQPAPAIAVDIALEPISRPTPPTDVPPGPQQTRSIPDLVPVEQPKITAPPSPAPSPPVPVPKPEKPRKTVKKSKPVPQIKKPIPDKTPPAEATTAPPSSETPPAPSQAAPAPGASSSKASRDPVTWQGALLAQLEKFKRYPSDAMEDRQEGVPTVTFTMDRKGHVLSVRLESGSGHARLDREALALPTRAEPLPVPPDSVPGDPVTLTVPVEFYLSKDRN